jgi:glycine/D-amino acid oxidase-like deaminating enzyme
MPVFSRLAVAVQLFSIIFTPVLGAAAPKDYDYVIVGGGVTGLVVANRLTEDKKGRCFSLQWPEVRMLMLIPSLCPGHREWRVCRQPWKHDPLQGQ